MVSLAFERVAERLIDDPFRCATTEKGIRNRDGFQHTDDEAKRSNRSSYRKESGLPNHASLEKTLLILFFSL